MKEQELFDFLKSSLLPDLERSADQFDGFDCITSEHQLFIELKSRHTHYDTLLLEKKKYDFLIEKAAELGYKPVYINSTPEGIWSFELQEINPVWEEKWLPTTTEFANTSKKMKEVTFLNVNDGTKLK